MNTTFLRAVKVILGAALAAWCVVDAYGFWLESSWLDLFGSFLIGMFPFAFLLLLISEWIRREQVSALTRVAYLYMSVATLTTIFPLLWVLRDACDYYVK